MRKLLFLFVVTMLSVTAMAQDVIYDKTNDAGVRTVVCSGMDLGVSNGMNVYVALAGFQYKSTIRYSLAVTIGSEHEVEIPDDSKCLLAMERYWNCLLFREVLLYCNPLISNGVMYIRHSVVSDITISRQKT